jgi:hypothetical protein
VNDLEKQSLRGTSFPLPLAGEGVRVRWSHGFPSHLNPLPERRGGLKYFIFPLTMVPEMS